MSAELWFRFAHRTLRALLFQLPPRMTRDPSFDQLPQLHGRPAVGQRQAGRVTPHRRREVGETVRAAADAFAL
ncbi:MAG: hypothetical protein ACKOGA_25170 [Planctomycetaceae bacterium]